jgi:hypothetical protein
MTGRQENLMETNAPPEEPYVDVSTRRRPLCRGIVAILNTFAGTLTAQPPLYPRKLTTCKVTFQMKTVLIAAAVAALAAAPALAADPAPQGGKPGSSSNPTPTPSKSVGPNNNASTNAGASGSSTGATGQSKELPGAADSKKPDSSLSTEGTKPKP